MPQQVAHSGRVILLPERGPPGYTIHLAPFVAEALEQIPREQADWLQRELRALAHAALLGAWPSRGPFHHLYAGPYTVLVELNQAGRCLTVLRLAAT